MGAPGPVHFSTHQELESCFDLLVAMGALQGMSMLRFSFLQLDELKPQLRREHNPCSRSQQSKRML